MNRLESFKNNLTARPKVCEEIQKIVQQNTQSSEDFYKEDSCSDYDSKFKNRVLGSNHKFSGPTRFQSTRIHHSSINVLKGNSMSSRNSPELITPSESRKEVEPCLAHNAVEDIHETLWDQSRFVVK